MELFLIGMFLVGAFGLMQAADQQNQQNDYQDDQIAIQEQAAADAQASLEWEKEQADIANQAMLTGMQTDLVGLNTQLYADTEQLATYERALAGFDSYANVQKTTAVEQGRGTFEQLMANYQGTEVAMAATGRTGGSGAKVAKTAEKNLERYAGTDLIYNTTGGGLFADQYQQLVTDLNEEKTGIEGQVSVFEQSIASLTESIGITEAGIADLEAALL